MGELMAIAPDLLAVVLCLFLLGLLLENRVVSRFKTGLFIRTVVLVIAVLSIEIASVYVDEFGTADLNPMDEVLYTCIYIAAPVAILMAASLFDEALRRFKWFIVACMGVFAVFILSNFFTHQLFTITGDTVYARGVLYPYYLGATLVPGIIFLWANIDAARHNNGYRQWIFFAIFALVVGFTAVEVLNPTVLVIWPAMTFALLLYYIYLRELQFAYDPLTGVLNRMAFAEGVRAAEERPDVGMVMLDLNVLKEVNDTIGHGRGDEYLTTAATVISQAFSGVGVCYRIGGDEFCVICQDAGVSDVAACLSRLDDKMEEHKRAVSHPFSIAYGYAMRNGVDENLYATLARADAGMYSDKERWRKYYRVPRT